MSDGFEVLSDAEARAIVEAAASAKGADAGGFEVLSPEEAARYAPRSPDSFDARFRGDGKRSPMARDGSVSAEPRTLADVQGGPRRIASDQGALDRLQGALQGEADRRLVGEPSAANRDAAFSERFANTVGLGLPRNIAAGVRSLQSGRPFGDEYQELSDIEAARARQHPVAAGAGTVGGVVAGAAVLPALPAAEGAGIGGRALANAKTGLLYGAAQGAIEGHSADSAAVGGLVGGAAGGVLSPVLEKAGSALLNSRLGRAALERWLANPAEAAQPNGTLTEQAAAVLREVGLDPQQVGAELADELRSGFQSHGEAGARKVLLDRFGLRGSKGQFDQDFSQQLFENTAARGGYGGEAEKVGSEFFAGQADDIAAAKGRIGERLGGGASIETPYGAGEIVADQARELSTRAGRAEQDALQGADRALNRVRPGGGFDPLDAGAVAAEGIRSRAQAARAGYQGAYERAAGAEGRFEPGAFDDIAADIERSLLNRENPVEIDHTLTPAAQRGVNMLRGLRDETIGGTRPARVPAPEGTPTSPLHAAPDAPAADLGGRTVGNAPATGNTVFTPAGRPVEVEYQVVDAANLRTSHRGDLSVDPAYPQDLQPRNRTRASSERQIAELASTLEPRRLGPSTSTADGAPIVGPDGLVESGNGRVLGIRRAYEANPQRAAAYRAYLHSQGYNTEGMREPVLVRVRRTALDPAERIRFAQESNGSVGLELSAAERAATDASRLGDALDAWRGGDVADASNRDFVRMFAGRVADANETGGLAASDGTLSVGGENRIRNALLHSAYGDTRLVEALAETGDENIAAFGRVLGDVSGDVAKLKFDAAAGRGGVDLSPALLEAARFVQDARARGLPLRTAAAQQDAFNQASPEALAVLRTVYGPELSGRLNRGRATDELRSAIADAAAQSGEANMFGEAPLTAREILEARAARAGAAGADSGAPPPPPPPEAAAAGRSSSAGETTSPGASVVAEMVNASGPLTMKNVDQVRKRLIRNYLAVRGNPNGREDARAAQALIGEFDRAVEQRMSDGLFSGDDAALTAYREARSAYRDYAQTFGPRAPWDDTGNFLRRIVERDAQPGEVSNFLYGAAVAGSGRAERSAARVRELLGADSPEWSAVQQGLISRALGEGTGRAPSSPAAIAERINVLLDGPGRNLARQVLDDGQVEGLRAFQRGVNAARMARESVPEWVEALGRKGFEPQAVVDDAFGRATVGGKQSSARFVEGLKGYFGDGSAEWNAIRAAGWQRLTSKPPGADDFGPQALSERIRKFIDGDGRSLARSLYTPEELSEMRTFAAALKVVAPMKVLGKSSNPNSDTAPALGAMLAKLSAKADRIAAAFGSLSGGGLIGQAIGAGIGTAIRAGTGAVKNTQNAKRAAQAFSGELPAREAERLAAPAVPELGTGAGLSAPAPVFANDNLGGLLDGMRSSAASEQDERARR